MTAFAGRLHVSVHQARGFDWTAQTRQRNCQCDLRSSTSRRSCRRCRLLGPARLPAQLRRPYQLRI